MNQKHTTASAFVSQSRRIVHISRDMVAAFASLTGDRSSLHVDDAFARRSAFRQPIAHGMLPLAFLAVSAPMAIDGRRAFPLALSGRFLSPIYVGDAVVVVTDAAQISDDGVVVDVSYRVEHQRSGSVATVGTLTIGHKPDSRSLARTPDGIDSLLAVPASLNDLTLEQILPGMTDELTFSATRSTIDAFTRLLVAGGAETTSDELIARLDAATFLAYMLFSTSVGVSLPGAQATFLEFAARASEPLEGGRAYRLAGRVSHRSKSTRIIKKDLSVVAAGSDQPVLTGKASVLVNRPARRMPTVHELKQSEGDLGLKGRVVIITGASRGIGETTAKLFSLAGAHVVINYHRGAADASRIVDEIREGGGEAIAVAADVSDAEAVEALVRAGVEHYGGVDILVNNAARDYRPAPFLTLTWDDMQKDLDVIVKGAFLCCQQVIPHMAARGGGRIINISSVATENPPPNQAKYVVAKSALVGLTRSLAAEFASKNIQVNLVVPNFVDTDFVAHVPDGFKSRIAEDTPMRRNASPVEVARAVVFLASSYATFTTGQKIMVTGGSLPYL
jgi:3-oxoacyl-[acyl-carrier protein] reductase